MEVPERDRLLLEILDRLARIETRFDEQVDVKHTARQALDISNDNTKEIGALKSRLDEQDNKWRANRNEKWGMWLVIVGGMFTLAATILGALIAN